MVATEAVIDPFNYRFGSVEEHVAALSADPLGQLERDLIDCGLEPLLATAILIYLVKGSAYAGRHVSLQIRGASESFKSMTVSTVVQLHPKRDLLQRQNITWASLMEGLGCGSDFRRKTLCLDESIESRKRDHDLMATIRELTTKEKVTRTKMQRGGPVDIELLGPATVIDCMLTDTQLTEQDVNRFLVCVMPDDREVCCAISALNEERFDPRGARRQAIIAKIAEGHQVFLSQLRKDLTVFKTDMLVGTTASPRFDSSVFGLVCTIAWLHQLNRPVSPANFLTATIEDYEYVWSLLSRVQILFPKSDLSGSATKLLSKWQAFVNERGNVPAASPELHQGLAPDMDPAAFGRVVNELAKAGYAATTGRGARGVKYQVLTPIGLSFAGCDLVGKLPTPDSLRSARSCAASRSGQV